jgi:hypothetical protein
MLLELAAPADSFIQPDNKSDNMTAHLLHLCSHGLLRTLYRTAAIFRSMQLGNNRRLSTYQPTQHGHQHHPIGAAAAAEVPITAAS